MRESTKTETATEESVPAKKEAKTTARSKSSTPAKKGSGVPRGPPRPHRRITQDVLETRVTKLQKRIKRARIQLEVSERHVAGYLLEQEYRKAKPE